METILDAVELTRQLVQLDTMAPHGNEWAVIELLGALLEGAGFCVAKAAFAPGRESMVATLSGSGPPLCFAGHVDTVPLGAEAWSVGPHAGEIKDGRLYGRGASDMKSGVAAMTVAGLRLAAMDNRPALALVFTAAEETACLGAEALVEQGLLPAQVQGLVVTEPTANGICLGHKGVLWVTARASGKAAHASMPEAGESAVLAAARAICRMETLFDDHPAHDGMGRPTLNVGVISGGVKVNMVPDRAEFEIDVRTVPGMDGAVVLNALRQAAGPRIECERVMDLPCIVTDAAAPLVAKARDVWRTMGGGQAQPGFVPYYTDASVLVPALGRPPTLIMGPGQPEQAHQTDEYCEVEKIRQATEFYVNLALAGRAG